jgi:hypothetical protein
MGNFFGSNHWARQRMDVTQVFVAATQALRVALGNNAPGATQANIGDICVQTDNENQWYIMSAKSVPSVNGDWTAMTAENAALVTVDPAILAQNTVQAVLTALAGKWTPPNATSIRVYGPVAVTPANPIPAHTEDIQAGLACVGVLLTDVLVATCPTLEPGIVQVEANPTANDVITIRMINVTAAGVATGPQNWYITAFGTV